MLHLLSIISKRHNVRISNVTTKFTEFEGSEHMRTGKIIECEEIEQIKDLNGFECRVSV
jgi:hypothetical protein